MVVVLDTNIIIQKPQMESEMHKVLYNYLEKTDSFMLMPNIVYKELPAVYSRLITNDYDKCIGITNQINAKLLGDKIHITKLDISKETKLFMDNIDSIYGRYKNNYRVDYDIAMLEETVRRAIYKIRPCSEGKEEFRDTLVWLSVIKCALEQDEKNIVFISNNTKDFCNANGELHDHLEEDIKNKDIKVLFYSSLEGFIKAYAKNIEGIDKERVMRIVEQVGTEKHLLQMLEKRFMSHFEHALERKYDYVDDIELLDQNIELDEFYIYEMKDDTYLLVAKFMASISVGAEVPSDDYSYYDEDEYMRKRTRRIDRDVNIEIKTQYSLNEVFDVIDWDIVDIDDM